MRFTVTILGSNSSVPAHGRHPTAQVVQYGQWSFLVDCGEGTQMRMSALNIRRSRIHHIFISHLHGDHYYGLIGLLTTMHLLRRTEPLHLYAPAGIEEIIDVQLRHSDTRLHYPLVIHPFDAEEPQLLFESPQLTISTLPMKHRITCCGFLFRERMVPHKIKGDAVRQFNIPFSALADVRYGKDIVVDGRIIPNHLLTYDPPPPASYAFCSDTLYDESLVPLVAGSHLMYYEATFLHADRQRAADTYHSTTVQAAELARKAGVGWLLIGHFSSRYKNLTPIWQEACQVFPNTLLAQEGVTFDVRQPQATLAQPPTISA